MSDAVKAKRERPLLEKVTEDGNSSFAKALGSVDFHTRERGLQALTVFLKRSAKLDELALRKLWKGLFYCFWHSDKAFAQEGLAERLAAVLPQLSQEVALQYFAAFLEAMQREWFGIDKLRLDKFLMLVRKFVRQMFVHLQEHHWQKDIVTDYTTLLKRVLDLSSDRTSAGLSFHLVDVYVQELLAVLKKAGEQISHKTLLQLLEQFIEEIATSTRASFPPRIREGVFEPLLAELENSSDEQPLKSVQIARLADHIFQRGARQGVKAKSRDILYELSAALEGLGSKKRKWEREPAEETAEEATAEAETSEIPVIEEAVVRTSSKKGKEKKYKRRKSDGAQVETSLAEPAEQVVKKPKIVPEATPNLIREQQSSQKAQRPKMTPPASIPTSNANNGLNTAVKSQLVKSSKKGQKLGDAVIARAAERTAAAVEAHKKGMTTLHPATPGAPSENNYEAILRESLYEEDRAAKGHSEDNAEAKSAKALLQTPKSQSGGRKGLSRKSGTDTPVSSASKALGAASSPEGSSAKQVRFHLKRNLYFQKGGAVPSPDLRTPDSCKPKGSALKATSKFSRLAPFEKRASAKKGAKAKKQGRRHTLGLSPKGSRAQSSKRNSL